MRTHGRTAAQIRLIGVAAIAAVVAVIAVGIFKPNPFASYEVVRAQFSSAAGIGVVGSDVRMAGTKVGDITATQRLGNDALLTLQLDHSAGTIHADATAELRPHLAFEGTAYVDLNPGSRGAPPLHGGTIPLSQTRVYVPLDEALRVFNPPTRLATQATARELRPVLTGAGRAGLQRTLHGAPALTSTLAPAALAAQGPHGTELAGALDGLSRTFAALASREAQLVPLTRAAARTFAALNPDAGTRLDRTLAELPPALEQLNLGGEALDGIVARLDPLAHDLLPGLHALARTLDDALPLVRGLGPALTHSTPLIADLRAALRAGATAVPAARVLLTNLEPSLQLLERSLLPALHAPTKKLHIPAYLSFINMFEGGGGASQPFQTGLGHAMRFGARFFTGIGAPLPPCTLLAQVSAALAQAVQNAGGCSS
jgi:virulence factor Mce-like protein